jgi:hypothetical protein
MGDPSKFDKLALLSYKLYLAETLLPWSELKDEPRDLYQEAYELARDNEEFGPQYSFSVMYYCYWRGFDDIAMPMWQEQTEAALENNDIGILRIMWRFLGVVSTRERPFWRAASELRRAIATRHPEVMKYRRIDRSWN